LSVEALEDRTLPSTFVVDRLTDTGAGSGLTGDLRYCITHAGDNDQITFDEGVTGTIKLTGALPALSHSIDIEGPGADSLTVRRDTGGNYRIFTVDSGTTVTIAGMTITYGLAVDRYWNGEGGGILNQGTLTLSHTTVSGNATEGGNAGYGGGIYNDGGVLTLNITTVSNNEAGGSSIIGVGGGIFNADNGTVTLNNSTVSGNESDAAGGIDNSSGTVTLNNSTVSDNFYGGIANENGGTLTLNNSTVSDNSIVGNGYGGGIWNTGTATLNNSTVSGNTAYRGGGIYSNGTLTPGIPSSPVIRPPMTDQTCTAASAPPATT
jgi:hypothetical protein